MFKWIRWSGVIGFVVIVGLMAGFFLLALGPLAKIAIESAGSSAAGAQVEVKDVDFTLSPMGFELTGLTVANADQPMENLLQFDQAVAEVEFTPLLLGKAIIKDLSVKGLRFNTPRQTSGALEGNDDESTTDPDTTTADSSDESATDLVDELPSVDEMLARQPLQTDKAGRQLQQTFEQRQQQIDEALAAVPDEAALQRYKTDVQELTSGNVDSLAEFNSRKQRLQQLRDQFRDDQQAIRNARDVIGAARTDITRDLRALRDAPSEDYRMLRETYQFNATGAANLSALLLGEEAGEWAGQALYWYQRLRPYLASDGSDDESSAEEADRLEGRFVHFPTDDPWPEFLIRSAGISAITEAGSLAITAQDITHQPRVLGRPARIMIDGAGLDRVAALSLNLTLDHTIAPGKDLATLDVTDWQLDGVNLGLGGARLESAMAQVQAMVQVGGSEADQLSGRMEGQFGQARFAGEGQTLFARELQAALATIDQFSIDSRLSGELTEPDVRLGSDLDSRLNDALGQRLRQRQDQLEARLQQRLDDKVSEYAGPYADDLQSLINNDEKLNDKLAQLEDLARAQLDDYVDQQKEKAREKAQDKARQEAEKLKEKAGNALKGLF